MKRCFLSLATMILVLGLLGCHKTQTPPPTEPTQAATKATQPTTLATEVTESATETTEPATEATEPATEATEPAEETTEPTAAAHPLPEHSPLYIHGLSVENLILYFNEVCLDAEFVNSGNPEFLQKWDEPILYAIYGQPTQDDLRKIDEIVSWLNYQESFPGIRPAKDREKVNLTIHFGDSKAMLELMGKDMAGLDGAATFWYENNRIYKGIVFCRTDIAQFTRNSVILEELYNVLGPMQDTSLRTDSIIYSQFSEPQELTIIDQLILQLLYHPQMLCGMNAAECEAVIRELYY